MNKAREPDAVNFWMGEDHSITSLHKDHYENLYAVIRGEKHFILYPPTDYPFMHETWFPPATYKRISKGKFEIIPQEGDDLVPWIPVYLFFFFFFFLK